MNGHKNSMSPYDLVTTCSVFWWQGLERAAGRTPDPRSQAAIDTRLRWINDEVTDAELCAAYKAARNAANHV